MKIYTLKDGTISKIKESAFNKEKEMQMMFEKNLKNIMGLSFVSTEFAVKSYRIDSLAFDGETNAFVIIEYKLNKNISVVDQGITYLKLMLENKKDFLWEYLQKTGKQLDEKGVDWSQSKVVFVADSFTDFQKQASDFKDFAIELWEVKKFDNNIVTINQIRKTKSATSVKPIIKKDDEKKVVAEVVPYDLEHHLKDKPENIVNLFETFAEAIQNLAPDIEPAYLKLYVAFKQNGSNICSVEIHNNHLKLYIGVKSGKLIDGNHLAEDVSNVGHWGTGDYRIYIKNTDNIEYIMSLIKQAIS